MEGFKQAYQNTMGFERGYADNPKDRGGETYRGIARKFWPQWEGWKLIDIYKTKYAGAELNKRLQANEELQNLVRDFYLENYWIPLQLDAFDRQVADELFDTAVNQGKWKAASYLQNALNKLNRNGKDYPDLTVDGRIGLNTIHAYQAYMATERFSSRNRDKLIKWLLRWLNYYQLKKYDQITYKDPAQEIFIPGWTERC
jgi:lysozyme family protein